MFDIGFSEIILIAIVALLVVGPKEFPALVRKAGEWAGAIRRAVNAVKSEFDKEVHKADEIKRLMEREAEIAETHKNTPPIHQAALTPSLSQAGPEEAVSIGANLNDLPTPVAPSVGVASRPVGKQEHGTPQP